MGMSNGIIAAGYSAPHVTHGGTGFAPGTETAIVAVTMVESIAVVPIVVVCPNRVRIPPSGIVTPIPRRCIGIPIRSPEPIVNDRLIDIYRLNNIVGSIDIFIANNLYGDFVRLVFLHIDGGNILVDVLGKDGLEDDKARFALAYLHHADVVNLAVAVEVEVAESGVGVVEQLLKILQVLRLCEEFRHHFEVQSLGDVSTIGRNRNRFVCARGERCHQQCRENK